LEPTRLGTLFKTYYAPNNCVVVVSGAIKTEEVKRLAQKYLEPIPAQPAPKSILWNQYKLANEEQFKKEVATPYLMIGYHTLRLSMRITTPIFSSIFPVANHPDCMLHW
jgi:predicted Zn-dependent peptidase